jgi:hypothetical protein
VQRRDFFKGAFAVTAASALGACGRSGAAETFPLGPALLDDLAARIKGRVVKPGESAYNSARVLFNAVYDYVWPAAIVQAVNETDVRTMIDFANTNEIALVGRSGGHGFGGLSTGPGIVLDVSSMNHVLADPEGQIVSVGAGAKIIDMVAALQPTRKAVPSGWCPSVGVAGLALGGGIGKLSRRYGLTCDHLRSHERQGPEGDWPDGQGLASPAAPWFGPVQAR